MSFSVSAACAQVRVQPKGMARTPGMPRRANSCTEPALMSKTAPASRARQHVVVEEPVPGCSAQMSDRAGELAGGRRCPPALEAEPLVRRDEHVDEAVALRRERADVDARAPRAGRARRGSPPPARRRSGSGGAPGRTRARTPLQSGGSGLQVSARVARRGFRQRQTDVPERCVPEEMQGRLIEAEHLARYQLAQQFAAGSEGPRRRLRHGVRLADAAGGGAPR